MAQSISKAQASLLATGFFSSLGSDKASFANTLTELELLAGELAQQAATNLQATGHVASGKLSSSIQISDPRRSGSKIVCDVTMLQYGAFINAGVKGLKGGSSSAGYGFKYPLPSTKMVAAIKAWIKSAKIATRNTTTGKTFGRHETKRKSVGDIQKAAAYAIARSIINKGIKGTGFMDKAVSSTANKIADRLGPAFEIDVITYLKK